jgi:hypothetical protein
MRDVARSQCALDLDGEGHLAREVEHDQVCAVSARADMMCERHISVIAKDHLDERLGDVTGDTGQGTGAKGRGQRGQCLLPRKREARLYESLESAQRRYGTRHVAAAQRQLPGWTTLR